MAVTRAPHSPAPAHDRNRLQSLALGTALFLLAAALILAMHALDPRRQAAGAGERPTQGGTEAPLSPTGSRFDVVPAVHG
ncbi:hypothetical protein [uncultured Georgenia sp.]|uniref:hypothetical protein n=1 Tax=uncultured Georgenia sp. TaxID=378209 RepID=UPI00260D1497|nr:hypothetical protein [uncultured Georgenia sp.]HLV04423.1 hypothetical protein [Actinomycetaceae bacterium]